MIRRNTLIEPYQFATGQYVVVRVGFVSDVSLTGKVIKFNPGFYTADGEPSGTAFQKIYPASATSVNMDNINCKNGHAVIIATNEYRFTIEFRFFVTKDLGDWLPDAPYSNATALNAQYFKGYLGFYISAHKDYVKEQIPIEVMPFCEYPITFKYDEFVPGKDLPVNLEFTGSVGNKIYVGIIQANLINQNAPIVPGLIQSYSEVSFASGDVFGFPNNLTAFSHGFNSYGSVSLAKAIISGDSLKAGMRYKMYVVYYHDGAWRSCISDVIKQKSSRQPIEPVISPTIEELDTEQSINAQCAKGLTNLFSYSLRATIDTTDYNTKLSDAGYLGNFASYYVTARAFIAKSANANNGILIPLTVSGSTFAVNNFSTDKNKEFVIIQVEMNIDGIKDFINIVFDLTFDAVQVDYNLNVYNSAGIVTEICDGDEDLMIDRYFDYLFQSIDNSVFVENEIITGVDIDVAALPLGKQVCFKGVESNDPADASDCDCPPCGQTSIGLTESVNIDGAKTLTLSIPSGATDYEANFISYQVGGGSTATSGSSTTTFTTDQIVTDPANTDIYRYDIDIRYTLNGCRYLVNGLSVESLTYEPDSAFSTESLVVALTLSATEDCECPEELVCNNYAAYEITCDSIDNEVTISLFQSFDSTIETEEDLCSLDGGITYIPRPDTITGETNIFLKYSATFDDGCDPVYIEQVVECKKIVPLPDDRRFTLSINSSGQLEIDFEDDFGSDPLEDILYISTDNGLTFRTFDILNGSYTPISVGPDDEIYVFTNTVFDDANEDLKVEGAIKAPGITAPCTGYNDYSLSASYDEETGEFTIVKTGDEVDLQYSVLLWAINTGDPFNGSGVPYSDPVEAEGLFFAGWRIKLPDCAETTIYATAYGKPSLKISELPPVTLINPPLTYINNCCDECPDLNLTITCVDRTLTITGFLGGATIAWTGPGGFTGTGNPVTFPEDTPTGTFTATITDGTCVDVVNYPYTRPEAGTPIDDPILV